MILRQIWQGCSPKLIVLLNHFLAAISLMIYCLYLHGLKFMLMFAYALCALTNNRNISLSYCRNQLKIFNHAFSRWVMNFIAFDRMLLKTVNRWKSTFPVCIFGDRIWLTPNHFLIGEMVGDFVPESFDTKPFNPRTCWWRVQKLVRHVWQQCMQEYLPHIGSRPKWFFPADNIQVGDVVVVTNPNAATWEWKAGCIK